MNNGKSNENVLKQVNTLINLKVGINVEELKSLDICFRVWKNFNYMYAESSMTEVY